MIRPGLSTAALQDRRAEQRLGTVRVPGAVWIAVGLAVLAAASLTYLSRHLDFFGDEWTFAMVRRGWTLGSFFRPHNEHLVAALALIYKLLFATVGMRSYLPYMLCLEVLHAATGIVLFLLVRRRAGDVLALCAVALFLFMAHGAENLFWAFQMSFVGSTCFGLLAILILDRLHLDRVRLALASAALLVSLLFSGVGLFFLTAVAVDLFFDRERRRYLVAVAVPTLFYLLWFASYGIKGVTAHRSPLTLTGFLSLGSFIPTGIGAAISGLFSFGAMWAILVLPVACVLLAIRYLRRGSIDARSLGLMAGLVTQYGLTGLVRSQFGDVQSASYRYIYVAGAFLLPLFADAMRDLPWSRVWQAALAVVTVGALVHGAPFLHGFEVGRTAMIRAQDAQFAAALAFRGAPDLQLDNPLAPEPGSLRVSARQYYAIVDTMGTPLQVSGPDSLRGMIQPSIDQAMLTMFGPALRVTATASTQTPSSGTGCQAFDPASDRLVDLAVRSGSAIDLVPAGRTTIDFYLSYVADPGPQPLKTFTLSPGQVYEVHVPDAGKPIAWRLRLAGTMPGPLGICPAGGPAP
ncbi:MAG: hypothetical protein ABI401_08375 [Candidatus Dormibacter sp.]